MLSETAPQFPIEASSVAKQIRRPGLPQISRNDLPMLFFRRLKRRLQCPHFQFSKLTGQTPFIGSSGVYDLLPQTGEQTREPGVLAGKAHAGIQTGRAEEAVSLADQTIQIGEGPDSVRPLALIV